MFDACCLLLFVLSFCALFVVRDSVLVVGLLGCWFLFVGCWSFVVVCVVVVVCWLLGLCCCLLFVVVRCVLSLV